MILHVNMSEYNPSLLGGLNWGGGSFARSQYRTVVYMTFFPNDEIQKFFPGFDGTLSIQYHELKLINITLLSTMPWLSINNLIHKIVVYTVLGSVDVCIRLTEGHNYGTICLFSGICFIVFVSLILFIFIVSLVICVSFSLRLPFFRKTWVELSHKQKNIQCPHCSQKKTLETFIHQ